ncbi:hypothetical protein, partial [Azospirillum argentinense]|uniref:hypothetical protein n=1 Tax=Azospirillum argentinense TaxID=2970906 RepID=UPI0020000F08
FQEPRSAKNRSIPIKTGFRTPILKPQRRQKARICSFFRDLLERELAETIGFPRVEIPLDDPGRPSIVATEARQIDRVLGTAPATRSLRRRLKRDLAAAQARWDAEAAAVGLTSAVEREAAADRRVDELLKTASRMPAHSLLGVIAKLAIATEWSELEPDADGYPWDFIRGVLADLTALTVKEA